ncbi:ComEC/Rec2 family competence protein [Marinobacterium sedimentorum]|uniref:ComEC/Rec2 family competence protein n=1 Tax=Marinobacterium sedimentorum TaxID=2927804 RepID=UPI0020C63C9F|nr:MBL fold metallo-hydrolase [Marinobacterium sedimentorum]MCP8687159.1 MBL fold metallo-hydrolase [Marinobacterium sedimentorum]
MGYQIDFLGVGAESKSGDAIAIRFGNLHGNREEQVVVVIDGGFKDTGDELVNHIVTHFGTRIVDLVISTHPDQDHINGLETVLSELTVNELWMHLPWQHNAGLASKFEDGRVTDNSLGEQLKESLEKAYGLYKVAQAQRVNVKEPFLGLVDVSGCVKVLGPSEQYYEGLIPSFDGMAGPKQQARTRPVGLLERAMQQLRKIFVSWGEDKISDDGVTSAKNNASVITQLIIDGRRFVFTADAGVEALGHAADQLDQCPDPASLTFIQVPHHGSQRNVGPSVLNRLVGEPIAEGETRDIIAIASTAKQGDPKHPRKAVVNAFTHRGARVLATRGSCICHHNDAPRREGWGPVTAEPYYFELDED